MFCNSVRPESAYTVEYYGKTNAFGALVVSTSLLVAGCSAAASGSVTTATEPSQSTSLSSPPASSTAPATTTTEQTTAAPLPDAERWFPTGHLAASTGWSSLPFLQLIRQPTLVLAGDDDPIVPVVNARIMARLLPSARLHVYGGGHIALVTEAAELAPVVEDFLDS